MVEVSNHQVFDMFMHMQYFYSVACLGVAYYWGTLIISIQYKRGVQYSEFEV